MSKKIKIIIIAVIGILAVGCGKKESMTAKQFKIKMEDMGLEVIDQTDSVEDSSYQKVYVAVDEEKYSFEYYFMNNENSATNAYDYIKNNLENIYSNNKSAIILSNSSEYEKNFKVTVTDYYYEIIQIENTVLYVTSYADSKEEAETIIDELGY